MKVYKFISCASIILFLVGCANVISPRSNDDAITYESALSSPNIGYIDYQSSDLLNNMTQPLFVNVSYVGKNGPFDIKKIEIKDVQPKDGHVRIYIPYFKDKRFEQLDLIADFGTVRVIGMDFNGAASDFKRLDRGRPTEVTLQNEKVIITSGITLPATYSATLLKKIIK
ncbi:hypothetical protein [Lelliottia nimipressuralis]|uniref:Lipoprotein n=1 Tax=Lelliottia nimipressuralis TaxID=69220 RepID=A0ABY3NY94_9ENTR|nr:hypothetical protein [Lelliottia nimipressuralis]RXJ10760.1 hypothetical protein ETG88_19700 [Lelliottia nimipressuralis]TYT29262.1 hypothetical protein FZO59_20985 [Lelliottia nimipressuralis]